MLFHQKDNKVKQKYVFIMYVSWVINMFIPAASETL